MSTLSDLILSLDDLKKEMVYVPEWDLNIYVREMSAGERMEFVKLARDEKQHARAEAFLVALVSCDIDGAQIFTLDQVDALLKKNAKAIDTLGKKILEINRIGGEEVIDDEKKDSQTTTKDASLSG